MCAYYVLSIGDMMVNMKNKFLPAWSDVPTLGF